MNTPETNNQNLSQNEQIIFPNPRKAIVSLIMGSIALVLSVISFVFTSIPLMLVIVALAVVGIILAAKYMKAFPKVGLSELNNYNGLQGFKKKELAIGGLVLSIMAIVFMLFIVWLSFGI